MVSIGIQLFNLIESFHASGYIHCDIKPDNIMIGDFRIDRESMNKMYLIDYGIAQKYLKDKEHIIFKENVTFRGNILFSSKHCF